MSLVQKKAPDFKAQAVMADGTFKEIKLSLLSPRLHLRLSHRNHRFQR